MTKLELRNKLVSLLRRAKRGDNIQRELASLVRLLPTAPKKKSVERIYKIPKLIERPLS
jgi:hypothetical protein